MKVRAFDSSTGFLCSSGKNLPEDYTLSCLP
jgi:hypothetical protein